MPFLVDGTFIGEADSPVGVGVTLPSGDVRKWLDERAGRAWAESSRQAARVLLLLVSDTLAGFVGVYTALETWPIVSAGGERPAPNVIPLLAMVFCLLPLALRATGAYRGGRARIHFWRVALGIGIAALLGWIQARLFPLRPSPDKAAYIYSATLILGYAWFARLAIDSLVSWAYRRGILQRRVLVIGADHEVQALMKRWSGRSPEIRVVGRLALDPMEVIAGVPPGPSSVPLLGHIHAFREALSTSKAQSVIVASNLSFDSLQALVTECFALGASVSVPPSALKRLGTARVEVRENVGGSLLHLHTLSLELPQLAVKRTMDVILTVAAVIVIAPVLAAVAIAIKLDSRGPVLFRQMRLGLGGRRFEILKFRTMVEGADAQKALLQHLNEYPDPRLFKIKHDPRITRIGRILRATSLDELPQLWNVLRGDMSLVGPRPCVPEEFVHYAPHHMERLFVVPGVTGPWQVSGRNSIRDFEEIVRMDCDYIRSWSILRDLVILAKTLPAVCGKGVY